jgi:flavodoxin
MKNLIVYYSWTGNTEVAAKELHRLIGGDLDRIVEVKPRKGKIGFITGAFEALFGLKSKIKHQISL